MSGDSGEKLPETMLQQLRILGFISESTEKTSDVIAELAKAMHSKSTNARVMAATWLGDMGEGALPHLIKALKKDDDKDVRINAAAGLGKIGKKAVGAVPQLIEALQDKRWDVRYAAIKALAEIGEKERTVPALAMRFNDEEGYRAAEALGNYGADKDVVQFLLKMYEGAPKARIYIKAAFIRIGADALPALHKEALEHPDLKTELQLTIGEIARRTDRPTGARETSEKPEDLSRLRARALDINPQKKKVKA